jgi:hypothetical protein
MSLWEKIKHTETYLQLPKNSQNAMQNLTVFRFFKVEFQVFLYSDFEETFPRSLQKSVTFGVRAQPRLKMTTKMKNGETRISAKFRIPLIKKIQNPKICLQKWKKPNFHRVVFRLF